MGNAASTLEFAIAETDAAKRVAAGGMQIDAERARGGQAIGHDAFAASLIDGRHGAIGQRDIQAAAARGDGGGQTGRSAADHEDIGRTR